VFIDRGNSAKPGSCIPLEQILHGVLREQPAGRPSRAPGPASPRSTEVVGAAGEAAGWDETTAQVGGHPTMQAIPTMRRERLNPSARRARGAAGSTIRASELPVRSIGQRAVRSKLRVRSDEGLPPGAAARFAARKADVWNRQDGSRKLAGWLHVADAAQHIAGS